MAAVLKIGKKFTSQYMQLRFITTRKNRIKMNRDRKIGPTIDSSASSLAAKGFLRPHKEYNPSENVSEVIEKVFEETVGVQTTKLTNEQKCKLLLACESAIGHNVPNSLLHTIHSLKDVIEFYKTPINRTFPLDAIRNSNLPKNLHIQYEYVRFNPDTDTMFNGISAFPESSTLVTGLKSKKKYNGYIAKKAWPS